MTLPIALVRLFPGSTNAVELKATSVREATDELNTRWPGMRDRLIDSRPAIRRQISILVGGHRARLETPLSPALG